MGDPVRILIADDHAMFRAGLRALLDADAGFEVVGEAGCGDEAVAGVRRLRPDVVLMDLAMPGTSGLEATRRIAAMESGTAILVLTVHAQEEYLAPVVEAGASGFLTKTSADCDLADAIRTVARGELFHAEGTSLQPPGGVRSQRDDPPTGVSALSPREREVLRLTAEGFSSSEIGGQLGISPKTVDTYRGRIMTKLDLGHRSELVRFALRVGLLTRL